MNNSSNLKYLIIHSTYTREGNDINMTALVNYSYSDIIYINGNIEGFLNNNEKNRTDSWDLKHDNEDINAVSRHIAYVGGLNKDNTNAKDTRTLEQNKWLQQINIKEQNIL